jgi:hypothetical protein
MSAFSVEEQAKHIRGITQYINTDLKQNVVAVSKTTHNRFICPCRIVICGPR